MDELADAEDALSEANILNNEDAEVWGYLSMVCLRTGRQLEAEQAYKYALKVRDLKNNDELITFSLICWKALGTFLVRYIKNSYHARANVLK